MQKAKCPGEANKEKQAMVKPERRVGIFRGHTGTNL
jgi:hypothetical protein